MSGVCVFRKKNDFVFVFGLFLDQSKYILIYTRHCSYIYIYIQTIFIGLLFFYILHTQAIKNENEGTSGKQHGKEESIGSLPSWANTAM